MSRRDMTFLDGCAHAWSQALEEAKLSIGDSEPGGDPRLLHDGGAHGSTRPWGLTRPGEGARAILEGWTEKDGRLPVNPSGGLKSKGPSDRGDRGIHARGSPSMQLRGEAGDMQVDGARLAGAFNMGGAAVANYVSILEPLR